MNGSQTRRRLSAVTLRSDNSVDRYRDILRDLSDPDAILKSLNRDRDWRDDISRDSLITSLRSLLHSSFSDVDSYGLVDVDDSRNLLVNRDGPGSQSQCASH